MTKSGPLTKRQLGVLEALFSSEQDEQDVLDKYKVSRKLFNRWMSEDNFAEQLNQYSAGAYRRSALPQLPSETASELLAVLAQKKRAADGLPLSLRGQSCCTSGP
ncbi:MAG: hypothetical protein ACYTEK_05340 [Planctomycetota bacterium]|jgi:hypothetical protein